MVKVGKWLRSFLTGKKERNQEREVEKRKWLQLPPPPPPPPPPPSTPKEMRRYIAPPRPSFSFKPEYDRSAAARKRNFSAIEKLAAIKIQASFRSFLARKALRALRALVKLQAVVRGFLVRKKAAATIRGMQALLTVQVRARAQRAGLIREAHTIPWMQSNQRRTMTRSKFQQLHEKDRIAEMEELGQSKCSSNRRKSSPITRSETRERRALNHQISSPVPSPLRDINTELAINTAGSISPYSPASTKPSRINPAGAIAMQEGQYRMPQDSSWFPNYMANTKSWKAKARSQSVPRPRIDSSDYRQNGKQRTSFDGKSLTRAAWKHSSSTSTSTKEQIPWTILLDRSTTSSGYHKFVGML